MSILTLVGYKQNKHSLTINQIKRERDVKWVKMKCVLEVDGNEWV